MDDKRSESQMNQLYMRRAIYLASCADLSSVRPNPRVGALLVYRAAEGDGRIIGEGYHHVSGTAHAEVHCLQSVRAEDRHLIPRSTMYVTLEPCAHEGRTGSCARRLVAAGIAKVVVGTLDPNPLVAGKGVAILREAGIEVEVGLLEQECREMARVFLVNQLVHRPYILLKWAESGDGYLDRQRASAQETSPLVLSTPFTQLLVHRLRGNCAAIMVGAKTAYLDHPQLTNRYWPHLPSPQPILLGSRARNAMESYTLPEGWLYYPYQSDLLALMGQLYERGYTSLLVEGGSHLLTAFLEAGLWDEVRREVAPDILVGSGVSAPQLPLEAVPCRSLLIDRHPIHYYYHPHSPWQLE